VEFGSEPFLIHLGSRVTISGGVRFVTHDGAVRLFRDTRPGLHVYDDIRVGSDVFIGMGSIIMPGVRIGNRCVVGAGSVVTKDVPDGSVVVGVPARRLKSIEEYEAGVLGKAMYWPEGAYDSAWRSAVIEDVGRRRSASDGACEAREV
jgi:acetyltransferase-like isoleucine patch superfamily enzyme